MMRSEKSKEF